MSLPSLVLGAAVNNAGVSTVKNHYSLSSDDRPGAVWDEKTPFPSSEWKHLTRQSWENVSANLPPNVDKDGFDSRNRIYLRKPATGLELPHYVSCAPIKPLGHVEGTRNVSTYVYNGSEITIRPDGGKIEADQTYTLLDPKASELAMKDRHALSYDILGKVKILGVQNGVYVGEIYGARETVPRGAILVPEIKRIAKQGPVPGASKVKGTIIADRRTGAFMSGQNKWIYIDRGTKDGVEKGMIFRIFQNTDPKTNQTLTPGEVFVQGDAQVLQGCENFSIGTFIWSRGEVPEQYEGVLITDIQDEKIRFYFNGEAGNMPIAEPTAPEMKMPSAIIDAPKPAPMEAIIGPGPTEHPDNLTPVLPPEMKSADEEDWLDKLDNHKELQSDEENELKELEKFHESQTAKAPPADAAPEALPDAPPGEGADLPPPPAEATDLSAPAAVLPPPPAPAPLQATEVLPPPPAAVANEFPSQEPGAPAPSTMLKAPPAQTATAPKAEEPLAPVDENSTDGLAPL